MPTYDYLCEKCGLFEARQSISDEPLAACPTCGGKVEKQFSKNVNLVFKGSGFYITDYRSKDYKEHAAKDKAAPAPAPAPPKTESPKGGNTEGKG